MSDARSFTCVPRPRPRPRSGCKFLLHTVEQALPALLEFGIIAPPNPRATSSPRRGDHGSPSSIDVLRLEIDALAQQLLPELVGLTDSFGFSDWELNSVVSSAFRLAPPFVLFLLRSGRLTLIHREKRLPDAPLSLSLSLSLAHDLSANLPALRLHVAEFPRWETPTDKFMSECCGKRKRTKNTTSARKPNNRDCKVARRLFFSFFSSPQSLSFLGARSRAFRKKRFRLYSLTLPTPICFPLCGCRFQDYIKPILERGRRLSKL